MPTTFYTDRAIDNAHKAITAHNRPPKFTAAADVKLTAPKLRTMWPDVLDRLGPQTRALAKHSKPWVIAGNRVYLRCDGEFFADMLNESDRRRRIIAAIAEVTGATLDVEFECQLPYPQYRPDVPAMTSQALRYIKHELNHGPKADRREHLKTEADNINKLNQSL